jgi:hypothetical protein
MENPLTSSLVVTLIGMAVVFFAMSLFYASMHLLTALFKDKRKESRDDWSLPAGKDTVGTPGSQADSLGRARLRAAAIAVALSRAELEGGQKAAGLTQLAASTPWGKFYRYRQLRPNNRGRIAR